MLSDIEYDLYKICTSPGDDLYQFLILTRNEKYELRNIERKILFKMIKDSFYCKNITICCSIIREFNIEYLISKNVIDINIILVAISKWPLRIINLLFKFSKIKETNISVDQFLLFSISKFGNFFVNKLLDDFVTAKGEKPSTKYYKFAVPIAMKMNKPMLTQLKQYNPSYNFDQHELDMTNVNASMEIIDAYLNEKIKILSKNEINIVDYIVNLHNIDISEPLHNYNRPKYFRYNNVIGAVDILNKIDKPKTINLIDQYQR
jgi:hypothetical protein